MTYNFNCPYSRTDCKECAFVENRWKMDVLSQDLRREKGNKKLTKSEKCWLRLLIYGYSPGEIAEKLTVTENHVTKSLSTTIYAYVSSLTGKKVEKYSQVRLFLQEQEKYEKISYEVVIPWDNNMNFSEINRILGNKLLMVANQLGIQVAVEITLVENEKESNNE